MVGRVAPPAARPAEKAVIVGAPKTTAAALTRPIAVRSIGYAGSELEGLCANACSPVGAGCGRPSWRDDERAGGPATPPLRIFRLADPGCHSEPDRGAGPMRG